MDKGLVDIPLLFLSQYIIEHKNSYYEGLHQVTEEQLWEPWILFMQRAVEVTAQQIYQHVSRIRELMGQVQ